MPNWQLYLASGAAAVAILCGSYGAGYLIGEKHSADQQAKAEQTAAATQVAALAQADKVAQQDRLALEKRDAVRVDQLQTQNDTLQNSNNYLQKALNAKPDPDAGVHIRAGDVRMLNDAAKSTGVGSQGIPDPAAIASYQEQAASDVSLRNLVSDDIGIREQYNELAAEHDTLVDWVQKELIDAQTPVASSDKK